MIIFLEAPHITLPERELVVKNGEQAVLRCIGEGIPDPKIKWFKGVKEIQPLSYIQIAPDGSLMIYDVQETDAGNYTCVAENEAGTVNETMFLNVGCKYFSNYFIISLRCLCKISIIVYSFKAKLSHMKISGFHGTGIRKISNFRSLMLFGDFLIRFLIWKMYYCSCCCKLH